MFIVIAGEVIIIIVTSQHNGIYRITPAFAAIYFFRLYNLWKSSETKLFSFLYGVFHSVRIIENVSGVLLYSVIAHKPMPHFFCGMSADKPCKPFHQVYRLRFRYTIRCMYRVCSN